MTIIPLLPNHEPSPEALAYASKRENESRDTPNHLVKAGELADHVSDYLKQIRHVLEMSKQPRTARDVLDYLSSLSPNDRRVAHQRLTAHFPQIKDFTRKTWMLDLIFPHPAQAEIQPQKGGDAACTPEDKAALDKITVLAGDILSEIKPDSQPVAVAQDTEIAEETNTESPESPESPKAQESLPNDTILPLATEVQSPPLPPAVESTVVMESPSAAEASPTPPADTQTPVPSVMSSLASQLSNVVASPALEQAGKSKFADLVSKLGQNVNLSGGASPNEVYLQLKALQGDLKDLSPEKKKKVAAAAQEMLAAKSASVSATVSSEPLPPMKNIFAAIVGMLSSLQASLASTPLKVLIPTGIALVFVLIPAILSVSYLISLFTEFQDTILLKNPVNRQSIDYLVARSNDSFIGLQSWKDFIGAILALFSGHGSKYKYMLFLIFPVIVVVSCVAGLWFTKISKTDGGDSPVPGFIVAILSVCLVQGIVAFVMNYIIFFYGNFVLRLVSKRIRSYNTYVYRRIFKDPAFLKSLTELQSTTFEAVGAIKETIRKVPQNINANDLAKVMFSVNMYMHYQKIGLRNPNIVDALSTFTPYYLLSPTTYSASDFLFRKRTYIDDYSEMMTTIMNALESDEEWQKPPTSVIYEANVILTEWIASANNKANSLYAEDALVPFIKMAIMMALVQWLPIILVVWIFRKPETRQALREFLTTYFARTR